MPPSDWHIEAAARVRAVLARAYEGNLDDVVFNSHFAYSPDWRSGYGWRLGKLTASWTALRYIRGDHALLWAALRYGYLLEVVEEGIDPGERLELGRTRLLEKIEEVRSGWEYKARQNQTMRHYIARDRELPVEDVEDVYAPPRPSKVALLERLEQAATLEPAPALELLREPWRPGRSGKRSAILPIELPALYLKDEVSASHQWIRKIEVELHAPVLELGLRHVLAEPTPKRLQEVLEVWRPYATRLIGTKDNSMAEEALAKLEAGEIAGWAKHLLLRERYISTAQGRPLPTMATLAEVGRIKSQIVRSRNGQRLDLTLELLEARPTPDPDQPAVALALDPQALPPVTTITALGHRLRWLLKQAGPEGYSLEQMSTIIDEGGRIVAPVLVTPELLERLATQCRSDIDTRWPTIPHTGFAVTEHLGLVAMAIKPDVDRAGERTPDLMRQPLVMDTELAPRGSESIGAAALRSAMELPLPDCAHEAAQWRPLWVKPARPVTLVLSCPDCGRGALCVADEASFADEGPFNDVYVSPSDRWNRAVLRDATADADVADQIMAAPVGWTQWVQARELPTLEQLHMRSVSPAEPVAEPNAAKRRPRRRMRL